MLSPVDAADDICQQLGDCNHFYFGMLFFGRQRDRICDDQFLDAIIVIEICNALGGRMHASQRCRLALCALVVQGIQLFQTLRQP